MILATILTFVFSTFAAAKEAQSATSRVVSQLTLTAEQKAKVDPIVAEDAKKLREVRNDAALSAEDKRKRSSEIRKDTEAKLKGALTEEQWKKYQELKAERKAGTKKKN